MDLYSGKIISWNLSNILETKWVIEAINKAKRIRRYRNKGSVDKIAETQAKSILVNIKFSRYTK